MTVRRPLIFAPTFCLAFLLGILAVDLCLANELGIKVPPGFEVTRFAGDDLAHDIFSITTDAEGRIAVSGPGYVKILEDHDADGIADRAHQFATIKSGALGLYFDGPDLIYTGDNKLARLRETNGDRVGDTEEVWTQLGHQEHGTHHIIKGPDGWFYTPAGNDAGVSRKHATTAGSPIKDPICGAILRFSPDGKQSEIIADGFRNMCGLDFNAAGHLFTVDSDNERDQHLPWYCPTRLFDVAIGQSHGWLQKGWQVGWNRPGYFFDSVEPLVRIGRGSPTGVVVYRHRAWPPRYRDGVFSACWSMGRIYFFPLTSHGSSYTSETEIFLEGEGATGLAIVGMTIDPRGDMYVAVGGRKTQGSVYRIRYSGSLPQQSDKERSQEQSLRRKIGNELYDVLTADQPLVSWSRARWAPVATQIGMDRFERVALDASVPSALRIRALEILTELGPGPSQELLVESKNERDVRFLARLAWAISRTTRSEEGFETLFRLTARPEPSIRRAAWEAVSATDAAKQYSLRVDDNEPFDRMAVQANWTALRDSAEGDKQNENTAPSKDWAKYFTDDALSDERTTFDRLAAIRQVQIALGDVPHWTVKPEVFVGYSPATKPNSPGISESLATIAERFPYDDTSINFEVARSFAIAEHEDPQLLAKIVNQCTSNSRLEDDIHYLIVLSRLPGKRTSEVTSATASAIVLLHHKLAARGDIASRNWPLRIGELFEELCKRDDSLASAIVDDGKFGRVQHSLFVSKLSGDTQVRTARRLLERVNSTGQEWDTDFLAALKALPLNELRTHLHDKFNEPGLRDSIALTLAVSPVEQDRAILVEALSSVQPNVVQAAASALNELQGRPTLDEIGRALSALRQQTLSPTEKMTRQALAALLSNWSGQQINVQEKKGSDLAAAYRPWFDWFAKAHPEEAKKLTSFAGDLNAWNDRLAQIDWSIGDDSRGKAIYEKRACHRCHSASGRLGPDLAGAAARFSREDLFAAILDPNRDVAPLYQTTEVVTDAGQSYNGLIVYESPDTTMIQTGPDTIVRLTGIRNDGMRKSNLSLMPTGLLNEVTDQDIADLYEYLKTLKK